jgi:hypothetical protein
MFILLLFRTHIKVRFSQIGHLQVFGPLWLLLLTLVLFQVGHVLLPCACSACGVSVLILVFRRVSVLCMFVVSEAEVNRNEKSK